MGVVAGCGGEGLRSSPRWPAARDDLGRLRDQLASRGLIDDSAAVIELVLKHSLACDFMRRGDTRERLAIEGEIKGLGHNAEGYSRG